MREKFIERKFKADSLALIATANSIIAEYEAQGFQLTLRQLYYQFVARAVIPNKQTEYKRLGSIINDARLAGLIDWDAIEDRTRNVRRLNSWDDPAEIVKDAAGWYREDLWRTQPHRVEVWIEKDALVGVIEGVCEENRVPFLACRGYLSQSEQYAAGKRFKRQRLKGQQPIMLHLGDHDPSGIDMTRDNADRLAMFARMGVEVRRLALNMQQVEQYTPPPNPAKETDSRFEDYAREFGDESWELDALEPAVIAELITTELESIIDRDAWAEAQEAEESHKAQLVQLSDRFDEVADFLDDEG